MKDCKNDEICLRLSVNSVVWNRSDSIIKDIAIKPKMLLS